LGKESAEEEWDWSLCTEEELVVGSSFGGVGEGLELDVEGE